MMVGRYRVLPAVGGVALWGLASALPALAQEPPIFLSADGRASINPDFADVPPIPGDDDFGRVLVQPDDSEFNLDYARKRAGAGDLVGAAATLERLLLTRPNWHAARLFYAVVLVRLDDLQAAKRELALLETVPLTPSQKGEAARYRRATDRRDATSRISGQVAIGVGYDSNAVGALANAVNLGAGLPIEDDGLSVLASANLAGSTRLGETTELFASAAALSKTNIAGPDQRYVRGDAQLGVGVAVGGVGVRAAALVRDVSIFGDHYEFDYGGRLEVLRRLGTRTAINASIEIVEQDFDEPGVAVAPAFGDGRDGTRIAGGVGLSTKLTARQTIAFELGYEDKSADYEPFAYRGPYASIAYSALLGRGSYASFTGVMRRYSYRAADLAVSPVKRRDTRSFVRVALGAPLSAFTASGITSDYRERLLLEGAVNYTRRDARLPYLDYDSVGAETRLIYRFGG